MILAVMGVSRRLLCVRATDIASVALKSFGRSVDTLNAGRVISGAAVVVVVLVVVVVVWDRAADASRSARTAAAADLDAFVGLRTSSRSFEATLADMPKCEGMFMGGS
jgi:hypothetical protein